MNPFDPDFSSTIETTQRELDNLKQRKASQGASPEMNDRIANVTVQLEHLKELRGH